MVHDYRESTGNGAFFLLQVTELCYFCRQNKHNTTMATATPTPMRSVVISFNPQDRKAAQFIETARLMDFFHVEDSPYDPDYVAMVKQMDKHTFQPLKRADLWK